MDMKIGKIGRIVAGKETGRYVKVVDDSGSTGGYLILTSDEPEFRTGFDNWAKDDADLALYARDAGWMIDWAE